MTAVTEPITRSVSPDTVTVSLLRDLLADLPPDTEMHVGVWDSNRFNILIGTLPVISARVNPSGEGKQLLLRVPGIS